MESAIIARFSSVVVSRMRVTCWSCALPTIVTTGVPASTSARRFRSDSALEPARRVEPKAASRAFRSTSPPGADARAKNSASLGLEPGQPAGDLELVLDGQRDALHLGAVAEGGVVQLDGGSHGEASVAQTAEVRKAMALASAPPTPAPAPTRPSATARPGPRTIRWPTSAPA